MLPERGACLGRYILPLSPCFASVALVSVKASVSEPADVQIVILYAEKNSVTFKIITGAVPIPGPVRFETGEDSALFAFTPWAYKKLFSFTFGIIQASKHMAAPGFFQALFFLSHPKRWTIELTEQMNSQEIPCISLVPRSSPAEALFGEASRLIYLAFLHLGVVCLLPRYRLCFDRCILHLPSFCGSAELVLA